MLLMEAGTKSACFPGLLVYSKTHLNNPAGKTCIVLSSENLCIEPMFHSRHSSGPECIGILFITSRRTGLIQRYGGSLCFSIDFLDFEFIQIMPNLYANIKDAGIYSPCCTS